MLQRFMDKNGGRLPDGRELPHKQSWAVAVWDAMGDDDERLQQLGFTGATICRLLWTYPAFPNPKGG